FADLDSRNALKQPARWLTDALRMLQVAGVVIGDSCTDAPSRRARLEIGEHFRDIAALCGEQSRTVRVILFVAQKMAVALHRRSAACRIHGDGVHVDALEGLDQALGGNNRVSLFAGMLGKRAATALLF